MELNNPDPIEGLIKFSIASMEWCRQESAKSVDNITVVINQLMQDSNRITKMTDTTLQALNQIKQTVAQQKQKPADNNRVKELTTALREIRQQHAEINDFIDPIISCLQFQDRLSQNLDNICKILTTWWENRDTETWMKGSDDNIVKVGEELLKLTTMIDERNVIRRHIPMLPEEQQREEDAVFMF